ncbi:paraquat-inducible protein A [Planctobacterium marinum]|uniref:Paraquat-inducible membrane protein PqiA family n=1 Tax=Planctobacterium marinum TaxID=1631968 RepID=A0AA48HMJ9_9ALTE|nr:paraquat-inducible membrane protein PqiA family [Planctobacterium marinum]
MKQNIGFILNILALGLFVPGIMLPIFSMNMEMQADLGSSALSTALIDKELSILGTVTELWNEQRYLVGFLILFFSVVVPLLKTSLVTVARIIRSQETKQKLLSFVTSIGKWSMADVFVVAIFLAVLSTDHASTTSTEQINMGLFKITFELSSQTLSNVGLGFWFFTAYCLISLAGTQLFYRGVKQG